MAASSQQSPGKTGRGFPPERSHSCVRPETQGTEGWELVLRPLPSKPSCQGSQQGEAGQKGQALGDTGSVSTFLLGERFKN